MSTTGVTGITADEQGRFTKIGKGIYLSQGSRVQDPDCKTQLNPTLILVFGWMGAKLPHLYKYTTVYGERYPDATRILIKCEASFFWSLESTRQANLGPVVEVLEHLGYIPPPHGRDNDDAGLLKPRVLVHAFSNGGCLQLTCLNRVLASRDVQLAVGAPLTSAIIFDSCPGIGNLASSKRAFMGLIRNVILRKVASVIITVVYFYSAFVRWLLAKKNVAEILKAALNNPRLLPWTHKDTPRLYIYSRRDELISYTHVEAHAQEAEALGLNVKMERFEDSAHVAHARADFGRYWGAVERVWSDACSQES